MNSFTINSKQLNRLDRSMAKAGLGYKKAAKRLLKEIGIRIQGMAKKYSPESPTKSMYARMNKSKRTARKASSITTGSLRDSIIYETGKDQVSIGVPSNSRAGDYAEKIHEEKGATWHNRGPRTVQKGRKADEKYIYRAADDSADKVNELIDKVIDDMIGEIGI